jgi:predicted anti-sigma-YlaC factor YlaD
MRCSSFEPQFDAYVEGGLTPVQRARIAEHVASCENCRSLLEEFRVIDALLLTPRQLEPQPNFTFKVMAEVRCLPRPHAHRTAPLPVLGAYVVFAWVAIGAFLLFGGAAARAMVAAIGTGFQRFGAQGVALAGAVQHLFGRQAFDITAAMGALLGLDLLFASVIVVLYTALRARRVPIDRST